MYEGRKGWQPHDQLVQHEAARLSEHKNKASPSVVLRRAPVSQHLLHSFLVEQVGWGGGCACLLQRHAGVRPLPVELLKQCTDLWREQVALHALLPRSSFTPGATCTQPTNNVCINSLQ